jgi:Bacterial membrane protein YfhO
MAEGDGAVSSDEASPAELPWAPLKRRWSWPDALALTVWTGTLVAFFWDAVTLKKTLFYFDITEINYPYRDFLANEMRSGRFSRWHPGLYDGFPIYAESQAGYWHPLKFLLYPWLPTWQALNLDTVSSVWLTGLVTYSWLRRHVGASGALTGAALFGLSGFVWAHLIHTSMTNALISVPLAFWSLELACEGGRLRGVALGALALACQVFAGHLQDTILTGGALGIWATYRSITASSLRGRLAPLGFVAALGILGVAVSAVQWVPSKDLLDRSPRAGGLTWEQITYGSWSPELLPTLVLREAYGTLARDTDWTDGYYPYHEMNAYLGLVGMALAVVGAGACRDRWVGTWVVLCGVGMLFMLGRYTCLFDYMNLVPIIGSSRIPVRYHLWVSLAVAALASVGVDRLSQPGRVRLGWAIGFTVTIVAASGLILFREYLPIWTDARRWNTPEHQEHFRWLGWELAIAAMRTVALVSAAWFLMTRALKESSPARRAWLVSALPLLVIADLLGSHLRDVPTIDPSYWTNPPASVRRIKTDPEAVRVYGVAEKSSAEPGFASRGVDFFEGRDTLAWSLPPVWGLLSSIGHTPIYPRRLLTFHDHATPIPTRFDVEGVTHLLTARPIPKYPGPVEQAGRASIHRNLTAQPRARLMARPFYVNDEAGASKALDDLGAAIHDRLIVEDPDRPLPESALAEGTAKIVVDLPERVEVDVEAKTPAYLVLADTFDPGWSAIVDGQPAPIRPAFAAFRAVLAKEGKHRIIFTYEPAGFRIGLMITIAGLVGVLICLAWPRPVAEADPSHVPLAWPRRWPLIFGGILLAVVLGSAFKVGPGGLTVHPRWEGSFHRFTWAAGIEAIKPMSKMLGR